MPWSHIHDRPAKPGHYFVLTSSVTIHNFTVARQASSSPYCNRNVLKQSLYQSVKFFQPCKVGFTNKHGLIQISYRCYTMVEKCQYYCITYDCDKFWSELVGAEDAEDGADDLEKVADDRCPHVAEEIEHLLLDCSQLPTHKHTCIPM